MKIVSEKQFFHERHIYDLFQGVYLGFVLLIICINILLFFIIKDKIYIQYSFHVIGTALSIAGIQCYINNIFTPDSNLFNQYPVAFFVCFSMPTLFFVSSFLRIRKLSPVLHKIYIFLFVMLLFSGFLSISGKKKLAQIFLEFSGIYSTIFILIISVFVVKSGYKPARHFLAGWLMFFSGTLVIAMLSLDLLPFSMLYYHAFQIGACLEIIIVSFAITNRVDLMKKEKDKWQMNTLTAMRENEKLIREQNSILERKIKERTIELEIHKEEIIKRNNEVEYKNKLLENANKIINDQNARLQEYNCNLEDLVQERTFKLSESYREILIKKSQLEQFTFVSAHSLRAPLATLLGLVNILDLDQIDSENLILVKNIQKTAHKLDDIIIDLNNILSLSQDCNLVYEEFYFESVFKSVCEMLSDKIDDNGVKFSHHISDSVRLYLVKSYVQNILYTLINNSLTHKAKYRIPEIEVKFFKSGNKVKLVVEDNGIGIDLTKYGDKIFGLYKRFNLNVPGKGLGLFIVKTQVELLGGAIKLESIPDQGTIIEVTLPIVHTAVNYPYNNQVQLAVSSD
ncbi:MAG: 7TM diverse intracellular signaling domain-containing protein [Cytophagaceae bacterium]